jgi:hypothetical protein
MKKLLYISIFIVLKSCSIQKADDCKVPILNLEMTSFNDSNNRLLNYYKTNSFIEILDTSQLLRYEEPGRIAYFFQRSKNDSTKRRYTYKVKEAIIKTANYQWDLLVLIDNDNNVENIGYWLKSYNNNREQVGHLDFAFWSADKKRFSSGRIDCDSTLHMILNHRNEHRVFKTDDIGKNNLIEVIRK